MSERDETGQPPPAAGPDPASLARAACEAVHNWAQGYFGEALQRAGEIRWADGPVGDLSFAWANSFCPIIYQHRDEAEEFLRVLFDSGLRGTGIEIGLEFGGTHMLLRQVCSKVISVEQDPHKVLGFAGRVPADERSVLICGHSAHRKTVEAVELAAAGQVDVLLIDGDHRYQAVRSDYLLYRHLVRPGGIVAFHDTAGRSPQHAGISLFLAEFRDGELDSNPHKLHDIIRSGTGISYEVIPVRGPADNGSALPN